MDIGKVKNLLIWTYRNSDRPIRVNDSLLTVTEVEQLILFLKKSINSLH